jgi:hypothetical protein
MQIIKKPLSVSWQEGNAKYDLPLDGADVMYFAILFLTMCCVFTDYYSEHLPVSPVRQLQEMFPGAASMA